MKRSWRYPYYVFSLCVGDIVLTLLAIKKGYGVECNPFMDWCIRRGIWYFVAIKCLVTLGGIAILEHVRFDEYHNQRRSVAFGYFSILAIYVALYIWFIYIYWTCGNQ